MLTVAEENNFPIKFSPKNFGEEMPFWHDLNRGSFAFVSFLAKVLLTGHPRGVQSYLDVLPFDQEMPMGIIADKAQGSPEYRECVKPLVELCKTDSVEFDLAFRHAYCLFRRHAIPFWSTTDNWSGGHPFFQTSPFAQSRGDIMGMVPVLDLALHSPDPNASVGYPDAEMLQWLSQERNIGVKSDKGYFVMQALRDIQEGEVVSVNKNAYFNFDDDTFRAWFGYRNVSQVPGDTTAAKAKEKEAEK
ncbi:hypothetical protein AGDE_03624 [Angomonas deanei]|nr:hypothetical protein AGDE_03624 [Angomonas deanei]|eukprot:EPY40304.1 hypothetical protein AGDE_03624 [Angomonas deanei]